MIRQAVTPLLMVFWGKVICALDLTFSYAHNGWGMRFDVINDVVGSTLVVCGVWHLCRFDIDRRYDRAMLYTFAMSVLTLLCAIGEHFVLPLPREAILLTQIYHFAMLAAAILFCSAMLQLSAAAQLRWARESWQTTAHLYWTLGIIAQVVNGALATQIVFTQGPLPAPFVWLGMLVMVVGLVPSLHMYVSIFRMQHAAARA